MVLSNGKVDTRDQIVTRESFVSNTLINEHTCGSENERSPARRLKNSAKDNTAHTHQCTCVHKHTYVQILHTCIFCKFLFSRINCMQSNKVM